MKKPKVEPFLSLSKQRSFQSLLLVSLLYFLFFTFQFSFLFSSNSTTTTTTTTSIDAKPRAPPLDSEVETLVKPAPLRPTKISFSAQKRKMSTMEVSGIAFHDMGSEDSFSELHKVALDAWKVGKDMLLELEKTGSGATKNHTFDHCPHSIMLSGSEFRVRGKVMVLPCGLTLGSHVTVVGKPYRAHPEYDPKIMTREAGENAVLVSQFMMELRGLNAVDGEEPPRILHFNPRLKGDWSFLPVIEMNTCHRMQWGEAQRCEGWKSSADEETVDELVKCEKWIGDDDNHSEESNTVWWLNRLIGRTEKEVSFDWPYPFVEEKLFILTLSAGLEGYHFNVNGRHITSFPYRANFVLEDVSGLSLYGDLYVQTIFAGSLPTTHPSLSQKFLEMSSQWKASPLPDGPIELFIGILSAGNHFAERMAVRKTWMQSIAKSPNIVARFFVAMHARKEVNMELKKEAEFFGDIVIVPYHDSYDLVVLKTVAICEYGIRAVSAKYIMKCDDDTFVRVDTVLNVVKLVSKGQSLYVGNINYYHRPFRSGKWAVTYEEWPEEVYPPYANGPGYIVSSDIAWFVMSEFEKHRLRLFKMEDVSMGMWVEQFNRSRPVRYVHSLNFCQSGCIDYYYTAHYQSPRQMTCMWEKLKSGKPYCCNFR